VNRKDLQTGLLILMAVGVGVVIANRHHFLSPIWTDWVWVGLSGAWVVNTVLDLRGGVTILVRSTYERAIDPIGFWTGICFNGALSVSLTIGAIGGLLKLWEF
jgi:hypothetical protein